jgi:hypothetical protein
MCSTSVRVLLRIDRHSRFGKSFPALDYPPSKVRHKLATAEVCLERKCASELATEEIRRMRGGAQGHLLRCGEQEYYVVKFLNNPQGVRVLANELLGTGLATLLGLPTPQTAVVKVGEQLIALTPDLVIQRGRGSVPCQAGSQFGSRYPGSPAEVEVMDFLPHALLSEVTNLVDFCGMFVFDKWTCNTDSRQAIFFRNQGERHYQTQMIDQGFCFNACEWNFPDAPRRAFYSSGRVYESVFGIDSFEPWLTRLETRMTKAVLEDLAGQIPPEWYNLDPEPLDRLLDALLRRREIVRRLINSAHKSPPRRFPNWK